MPGPDLDMGQKAKLCTKGQIKPKADWRANLLSVLSDLQCNMY